jgi:hypothetical protein
VQSLKRHGVPVTRANYLGLAFGDPQYKTSAEEEAALPEDLQLK